MKLKELKLGGNVIEEVGDPWLPQHAATRNYVDSKFASWSGQKDFIVSPSTINEFMRTIPRMGMGQSVRLILEPGNYDIFKLAVVDYEFFEIYCVVPNLIGNFNIANRDLKNIQLRNLNGSNLVADFVKNKITFSGDTITTKLRDETRIIIDQISDDTFVLDESLPVHPGEQDVCIIERPGAHFSKFEVTAGVLNTFYIDGVSANSHRIYLPYGKLDTYFCKFSDKI